MASKKRVRAEHTYGYDYERREFARLRRRQNDELAIAEGREEVDEEWGWMGPPNPTHVADEWIERLRSTPARDGAHFDILFEEA